ncbi:hypothetical protein ANO11243_011910 [Dothideomycetidae sp. 11243]|nr:hypothetical protein ANO11243_011910 [fungal sp. No.11243]
MVRTLHGRVHGMKSDFLPHLRQELRDQAGVASRRQDPLAKPDAQQKPWEASKPDHRELQPGFLEHFVQELKNQAGSSGKR